MALYHNRFVHFFVGVFLKLALTPPGRWLIRNYSARFDPIVYRWTRGRLNSTGFIIIPMLVLTTTGRKSGQKRSVQLAYVAFDGNVYLVASNLGSKRHPAWMYNIEADPKVSVQIGGRDFDVTAQRLTRAEKAAVWSKLVKEVANFDAYEERSGREVRVYRLPVPGVESTCAPA